MRMWQRYDQLIYEFQEMRRTLARERAFILILFLLSFSLLVDFYTNLNIRCSIIGIIGFAIIILLLHWPQNGKGILQNQARKQTYVYVLLLLLLVFDTYYITWLSLLIWIIYLAPWNYFYLKNRKFTNFKDYEIGLLVLNNAAFILETAYLLRYERYISFNWGLLMIPMIIIAIFIGIIIGVLFYELIKHGGYQLSIADDFYQDDPSEEQRLRKGRAAALIILSFYLCFLITFMDLCVPSKVYEILLLFTTILVLIQILLQFFFDKYLIRLINKDFFVKKIIIQKRTKVDLVTNISNKVQQISNQDTFQAYIACIICDKTASIWHYSCKRMVFCLNCYQDMRYKKQITNLKCPICYNPNYFAYAYRLEDVRQNRKPDYLWNYLLQGEMLVQYV